MGFTKSSLVSVSDVFRLTDLSLPEFKYSLAWYAFMLFVVGSTVLWGRVYCGRVCAFGALTQLLDPIVPRKMRLEIPVRIEKHANLDQVRRARCACSAYYLATQDVAGPIRYVEPFWMFSLFGTTGMWIGLAVLLTATVFVRNLYCRFLCPVGAALGIISQADDGLPDQALVRVQHLQDLREDLRVGRDPRAEDRQERVRALRRLRAALHGSEEVPALADPVQA